MEKLELGVIILLLLPWSKIRQAWHRHAEERRLSREHVENERVRLAVEHGRPHEE